MIPFLGYAPDVDPTTPGVITNCSAIVPSSKGFEGAPSPADAGLSALGAACRGAAVVRKTDDTPRVFAGTASNLYEAGGTSWTDRTGTVSGLGSSTRWRFAQFGDVSLAAAKTEKLQSLSTASAFANATSVAPRGAIVETVNNFVFLFDVQDQGALYDSLDRPDGWWCAAKGGYESWLPSQATEAATNNLRSTPGKITAGRKFGQQIIAYKARAMYMGTYVGAPIIWDWQLIPGEAGALSQEVVVNIGTPEDPKHIFMGFDNFYTFAGGRAVPVGNPLKDTVFSEMNAQYYYACQALHDPRNSRVYFYYPVNSSINPDKCVVYNYKKGTWGRDDRSIEACLEYIGSEIITYDSLGTSYSTYDDLPNQAYDEAFVTQGSSYPAIIDTAHTLKTLTGIAGSSSITLGDYGDDQAYSDLTRVTPKFLEAPDSASLVNYYRDNLSDDLTTDQTTALVNGRFDFLRSARWHRARFDMVGDHEISGFTADILKDGDE